MHPGGKLRQGAEFELVANAFHKVHCKDLPIKVAAETEEVHFDGESVLVDGRAVTDISHAIIRVLTVKHAHGIHTFFARRDCLNREVEVCCWKSQGATQVVPMHHGTG